MLFEGIGWYDKKEKKGVLSMKILIVDLEEVTARLIRARLAPVGHEVDHEADKANLVERMRNGGYDVVFIDPSPVASARAFISDIRKAVMSCPYVVLMSETLLSQSDAMKMGANDVLAKPLDMAALDQKIDNAALLLSLMKRLNDDSEDFPSAGGIIAKSAFNQLFLSAIDRADRYGERTYLLSIALSNHKEVAAMEGQSAADNAVAQLSRSLVNLRRQSDIIGQTACFEYTLLLHNAGGEKELLDAASRFAESLKKNADIASSGTTDVRVSVILSDLPVGAQLVEHVFVPRH